jgi:prolyl oligopeptidase
MEFVKATWALLIFLMALPASAWAPGTPPAPARKVDTVDHEFGLTLPDPYRWMEGDKNPEFAA